MKKISNRFLLFLSGILLLGFLLRIYNIDWDRGFVFHPDERAILLAVERIEYPKSFQEFLSPNSAFNTNFFAYGNFPIYTLKILSDLAGNINPIFAEYSGSYLIGRLLNVLVSTLTILLVFLYAKKLFNSKVGLLSAFILSIAVFPIQNAHFFTVDTLLTFFLILILLFIEKYIDKPNPLNASLLGVFLGLALATKISALPIFPIILFGFIFSLISKNKYKKNKQLLFSALNLLLLIFVSIVLFIITQPYAVIDFKNFFEQISMQSKMGSDPFIFPYTLQYVGKIPIYYELKNILLWGLGLPIALSSIAGVFYLTVKSIVKFRESYRLIIPIVFFWIFFLITSSYAVGWMRYLLPIYPVLAIFAGVIWIKKIIPYLNQKSQNKKRGLLIIFVLIIFSFWTISFMSVYYKNNTKIEASNWINSNIAHGASIAIEHWDDQLPIYGAEKYTFNTLPLYEPDTKEKWDNINSMLKDSQYLILASNRLYTPLQKLTNCNVLPKDKCYPKTAKYYHDLFSGKLGYRQIAVFESAPTIPFTKITIDDQSADESFTVYDHPKIMIFKKSNSY